MDWFEYSKKLSTLLLALTLAACGGGGEGDDGGNTGTGNAAPTANAGADQSVNEFDVVTLDGSLSADTDGDSLTYSWTQTVGTSVTLSDRNVQMPTFDAPDVTAATSSEVLRFELTVNDGSVNSIANSVDITVNDAGLGANSPPTANAGSDQTVMELTLVTLDGSGSSDPDGTPLNYVWSQVSGPSVTLSDAQAEMPTFTAPDVPTNSPATLVFEVSVDDGADSDADTVSIVVMETLSQVSISGILRFEHVNPNPNCNGLSLANPEQRPMRGVPVELRTAAGVLLDTTTSGEDGSYAFANVDPQLDIVIRARAELQRSGPVSWDVQVRDNTSNTSLPRNQRPMYVIDFAMNSGTSNVTDADFLAVTGWPTAEFDNVRAAAPFAMLDYVRQAMDMVVAVDPVVTFPALEIYWSVNNTLIAQGNSDIDAGELTSTFYTSSGLYILGDSGTDTDDYDDHVIVHEWGHYFEDIFSRSDSMGGSHYIGEPLDPRLAFGEGFASALAGIALQEPLYCDTSAPLLTNGFGVDWEFDNTPVTLVGWMNELNVGTFIYDLWDTNNDGADNSSIGFGPIYETMVGPQAATTPFTSVFTFAAGLRPQLSSADRAFVDAQLNRINVDTPGNFDEWGGGQTTVPTSGTFPAGRDVLPYYTTLPTNGQVERVCLNDDYLNYSIGSTDYELGPDDSPNKFGLFRHFRITVPVAASYTITATASPAPPPTTDPPPAQGEPEIRDRSDPDLFLHRSGQWFAFASGVSGAADSEVFVTPTLAAGEYIMRLQDWRFVDDQASSDYPTQTCFDVSMSP